MKKKDFVLNKEELAAIVTKLEGGKSSIKIADMRQAMKLLVSIEASLIKSNRYKSLFMMLRKEARMKAKSVK